MTVPIAFLAGMIASLVGLLGLAIGDLKKGKGDRAWKLRQENRALREALAHRCPQCKGEEG